MPSRRNLIAVATGGVLASLGGRASFRPLDCSPPPFGYDGLAALCLDLGCADPLGQACVRALPRIEASAEHLGRLVLAEMSSAGRDCTSAIALRRSVREQSRADFDRGRITNVDGWMLSLTETRVYAIAALLAADRPEAGGASRIRVD